MQSKNEASLHAYPVKGHPSGILAVMATTVNVTLTIAPATVVTVGIDEYYDLLRQNLIYSVVGGGPVDRPDFSDEQYAELEDPAGLFGKHLGKSLGSDGTLGLKTSLDSNYGTHPVGMDFVDGTPNTRRSTLVLSAPNTTVASGSAIDYAQRVQVLLPVKTTRWRFRIANRNILAGTSLTSALVCTDMYLGAPAASATYVAGGRWSGSFVSAPAKVLSGFSVPTDGSDYVSPWVTDSSKQFQPYEAAMLSYGLTAATGGTGYARGASEQWAFKVGGSAEFASTTLAAATVGRSGNWGDVRIEYEYTEDVPIVAVVGTSLDWGYGDGDMTTLQNGCLAHEAWPVAAGLQGRFVAINLAIPSAVAANFGAANLSSFTRVDWATTVPDVAVVAGFTNDVGASRFSTMTAILTTVAVLKSLGVKRIVLATLPPRGDIITGTVGSLAAAASSGATSVSSTISVASGQGFQIGTGRTQQVVATTGAPTGSGPYTIPVPALSAAHASGEVVYSGSELNRRQINDFIRQVPQGVHRVLDFDRELAATPGASVMDPNYASADTLHILRAGAQKQADIAAALGR